MLLCVCEVAQLRLQQKVFTPAIIAAVYAVMCVHAFAEHAIPRVCHGE